MSVRELLGAKASEVARLNAQITLVRIRVDGYLELQSRRPIDLHECLLIVLVGTIIRGLVIALYLPIFDLGQII